MRRLPPKAFRKKNIHNILKANLMAKVTSPVKKLFTMCYIRLPGNPTWRINNLIENTTAELPEKTKDK